MASELNWLVELNQCKVIRRLAGVKIWMYINIENSNGLWRKILRLVIVEGENANFNAKVVEVVVLVVFVDTMSGGDKELFVQYCCTTA